MMRSFFAKVLADALAPSLARWSASREKQILACGEELSAELIEFATRLGIESPNGLRLEIVERIPFPIPAWLNDLAKRLGLPVFHPARMCLGRGISAISEDPSLLHHELVHSSQYQRLNGHHGFMHRYVFECLLFGYFDAPLEQEARHRSSC